MYMIGLIPYGLSKLFNLWLFANHMQTTAAKNATYSLIVFAVSAAILIKPLVAMGLALSGSISGIVGLVLSIKYFGIDRLASLIDRTKVFKFTRNMVVFTLFVLINKVLWLHI